MKTNKLELTWIGKNDVRKIEPRILIEDKEKSYGDQNTENMLIHGDNLLALKALEDKFTNKIKCIYIDPPYNTGSAFENYEDGLEHSIWLTLMKRRLEILKTLLRDDGMIFIQIDDNEQAYLKVLCDEIFGRNNFVNCIAIKMSPSSGVKRRFANIKYIKNKEYILVYKKKEATIVPLYDEWKTFDNHYSIYFDGQVYNSLSNMVKNLNEKYLSIKMDKYMYFDDIKEFIIKNAKHIYRTHSPSKWALENLDQTHLIYNNEREIYKVYNPANNDEYEYIIKLTNGNGYNRLEPLEWNVIDGKIQTLRGDFWDGFEADIGNVSKEGKTKLQSFGEGQKPERLIKEIIESTTKEGEWVLDSFLGSGTTAAVAHKMNRKWIGIELGEQCYTYCRERINLVINGDKSGVSQMLNWQGGGGYKFYELAPSLLEKDKFNNWVISEEYDGKMLIAAICKQEKFNYEPQEDCYWKHGKSTENDYIYVTTNFLSLEYLNSIKEEMKENESLLICCKAYQEECEEKYDNITIKKIPQAILNNCEYGRDDYSLNVKEVLDLGEDDE